MCHADIPPLPAPADVERRDRTVNLQGGDAIPVTEVRPVGRSGPAIVIGTDIFGRSAFHLALADRLAAAGYVAIVPEVFFRAEAVDEITSEVAYARLNGLDEPRALDDLSTVIDWAAFRSAGGAPPVGVLGFCLGGTFALALAARRADTVTACFYGFPGGHPPKTGGVNLAAPLEAAAAMHGPILGFWGAADGRVGLPDVGTLDAALSEAGVAHDFTIVPGADHGFMTALLDPGAAGHATADAAWTRTLGFFDEHLGVGVAPAA